MSHSPEPHKPLVIALTGGIGSGKSAVADCFARLGVPVIDTDVLARTLVVPGSPILATIARHFGNDILSGDGSLDRRALRSRVFTSDEDRVWLENLLHPAIRQEVVQAINRIEAPYVVLVIPLLAEKQGYDGLIDQVLVVDVPPSVQIGRASARDRVPAPDIEAIMKRQSTREARLALADQIIDNSGSAGQLPEKVGKLHEHYIRLAREAENH